MMIPLVLLSFFTLLSGVWSFFGLNEGTFVILLGLPDMVGLGASLEFSSKGVGASVVLTKSPERASEGAAVGVLVVALVGALVVALVAALVGALVATNVGMTVGLREGTDFKE
jgi:hypothetical protein